MMITEFAELLASTGLPVAFYQFPEDEPHEPPFLCYLTPDTANFSADGVVYYSGQEVQVELYTINKDLKAEAKVEEALASFYWEKNEGFIESEKMYMVTYQLTL